VPREWIFLECSACGRRHYRTTRNPKAKEKLEFSKYCSACRKHVPHKERKK
jgi:large subunit ribosomal protein L33